MLSVALTSMAFPGKTWPVYEHLVDMWTAALSDAIPDWSVSMKLFTQSYDVPDFCFCGGKILMATSSRRLATISFYVNC